MISPISYHECLALWNVLWAGRVSPIEPTSAMAWPESDWVRRYSMDMGEPTFLGAFRDGKLVGVNSLHRIDDRYRSRGLFVQEEYRGTGVGVELLEETILRANGKIWSYPKEQAVNTYVRAGFKIASPKLFDEVENKWNIYVST